MKPNSCLFAFIASILAAGFGARSSLAADACDPLYQSGLQSVRTPHRVYSTTTTRSGNSTTSEAVYVGGVEYINLHGHWSRSPMTQKAMIDAAAEKMKTHPDSCTRIDNDDHANGQAVVAYKAHNKEVGTDQEVWIIESKGLIQGSKITLPNGSVVETRYEYDNVNAPEVATDRN